MLIQNGIIKTAIGMNLWRSFIILICILTPSHNPTKEKKLDRLRYVGAPRNDGLILMPNTVEDYRVSPKAFEFKNTNGFVVTIDANSEDYKGM